MQKLDHLLVYSLEREIAEEVRTEILNKDIEKVIASKVCNGLVGYVIGAHERQTLRSTE